MNIRREILKQGFRFDSMLKKFVKEDCDIALALNHDNKILKFKLNKPFNFINSNDNELKVIKRLTD